jgi:single-strand DNA-binding protein
MVNKVIIVGNLGKDPEVKELQSGKVCNFSVATSHKWKDKTTNERKEETEWHNVTCYGGLATVAGSYLHKGSKVYIEGRIKTRKYQAKDGTDRYITEIIADDLKMLDGKTENVETTQAF